MLAITNSVSREIKSGSDFGNLDLDFTDPLLRRVHVDPNSPRIDATNRERQDARLSTRRQKY
jgi:hypothetical protein